MMGIVLILEPVSALNVDRLTMAPTERRRLPEKTEKFTINYLFDKKKENFFWGGGTSDKTAVFSMRTKNKVEKHNSFFIGHEVLFYETAFSASSLEH
jgi:hypothetical protein